MILAPHQACLAARIADEAAAQGIETLEAVKRVEIDAHVSVTKSSRAGPSAARKVSYVRSKYAASILAPVHLYTT